MFIHRRYQRFIYLACTGDLPDSQERLLEEHLQSCERCRRDAAEARRFQEFIFAHPLPPPGEEALQDARSSARSALTHRSRTDLLTRILHLLTIIPPLRPAPIAAGVGLFIIGMLSARLLITSGPQDDVLAESLTLIDSVRPANVQVFSSGISGSEVEIRFDAVRPIRVQGRYDEPRIQRILAYALLNGDNAGVRLRAVNGISTAAPASVDREAKAALILALTRDENDGVRRESLRALLRYPPDREIRDALLSVLLNDPNPGLRVAAINGLADLDSRGLRFDERALQNFRDHFADDDNLYVRAKARTIIGEQPR